VALFCNPASGGTFSSTAIEIIKRVKFFAVAQAKVTHILRPGKASEKTPKGVIPPSLCEISQNASRKKKHIQTARCLFGCLFWVCVLGMRFSVECVFYVIFSVKTHSVATDGETHTKNVHPKCKGNRC
jgi:hypothetical protein